MYPNPQSPIPNPQSPVTAITSHLNKPPNPHQSPTPNNWLTSCKSPIYRHKTFTPKGVKAPVAAGK
ncbi:hypothetical protein F6R97_24825 [Pseudomonas sp. JV414]|nr:hypothetical protein [Pseudomonas sp. JV414]